MTTINSHSTRPIFSTRSDILASAHLDFNTMCLSVRLFHHVLVSEQLLALQGLRRVSGEFFQHVSDPARRAR